MQGSQLRKDTLAVVDWGKANASRANTVSLVLVDLVFVGTTQVCLTIAVLAQIIRQKSQIRSKQREEGGADLYEIQAPLNSGFHPLCGHKVTPSPLAVSECCSHNLATVQG